MKHLIVCREYPPAPGGGIGTYVHNISRLLAEHDETVYVIAQLCGKSQKNIEELCSGKLIVHRVPFEDLVALVWPKASSLMSSKVARALYASDYPPLCFSWLASALAERLVEQEGIDVIEAQDYEAPLYYFQLRRALGLGPKRQPPCFVHLHSPTEFIARHNEWNPAQPALIVAKRVERYSISAADAVLCPSRFLARQTEAHYRLPENSVEVIPYPLGEILSVGRDEAVWSNGTICYVGRLEKRKGVQEWIDAAVKAAGQNASASFEFVGANVLGANPILSEACRERLIPRSLKKRFVFHGKLDRRLIPRILERARIAVVPSRWENFPYACVEAMAGGLPVIASPEGGMAEMIADGQTGWIAERADSGALQKALVRALETPPRQIAEMGCAAAKSIGELCDNQKIVDQHMRFRRQLLDQGKRSSVAQPPAKRSVAKVNCGPQITTSDVLLDFASSDGCARAADALSCEQDSQDQLERFRQLVASDTESTLPLLPGVGGWNGRAYDPVATLRCLVSNPKIGVRAFQQVAAEFARR